MELPTITGDLPGFGGQLRATDEHFVVEEVPLYAPCGEGQHLYVNITKTGLTTKEVQRAMARIAAVREQEIGFAGLKDKRARTTQTFSLPVHHADEAAMNDLGARLAGELPVTVNWVKRHNNKLRIGHLLGNHFRITVTQLVVPADEALVRAAAVAAALRRTGLPNYFGPQRFGDHGQNVVRGLAVLKRKQYVKDRWLRRFLVSAYQSYLCNRYLARRVEGGMFEQLLAGDVAKKTDTGGIFDVEDVAREIPRYASGEISFTAPMFGAKMRPAHHEAGALEAAVLAEANVTPDDFAQARVDGTRRMGRLLVPDIRVEAAGEDHTLKLEFFLPKGAFATTVLREFMKVELVDVPDDDDGE